MVTHQKVLIAQGHHEALALWWYATTNYHWIPVLSIWFLLTAGTAALYNSDKFSHRKWHKYDSENLP